MSPASAMADAPYFHEGSREVRFSVDVDGERVWASIGQATLRYRFRTGAEGDDALKTFWAHTAEIESAVRRRVAEGSLQPVMLREFDFRPERS
ncbi:DUF1488 domain-containing protein [Rhizobacter sp. J219]|jgi:hypothetical protein|uniref:DUF1488 domain-containing protein n=1 Tax=Rhizobacter sp. J219 TaxID=2898430 RepID=UPI0021516834|nr:DUF1488 domain-containing protein [Rhizobacter sp. J219]MCR5882345.1 DUF1488 domain-containing protein [Rhizobacter sp. J219]